MDTLTYAKRLRAAGFDEAQAEAITEGLRDTTEKQLATKADLRQEILALETRLIKWMIGLIVPSYALLVGVLLSLA